jgi:hypothetical protein
MGGFTAAITRVTNLFLSNYQGFVMTKSMIKKLYTKKVPNSDNPGRFTAFGDGSAELDLTSE